MYTQVEKSIENKNKSIANNFSQKQSVGESAFQFVNNRSEAIVQRKLQAIADNYSVQQQHPIQKKENKTALPDNLESGIANLSGYSKDDVKVHYNSNKPAQLHAHAHGADIHLTSGQEKSKVVINDDSGLEKEAYVMGGKAMIEGNTVQREISGISGSSNNDLKAEANSSNHNLPQRQVIQRYSPVGGETRYSGNHQFMLLNSKSLWTQQSALDTSNNALNVKNSFVRLVKTGLNIESAFGGILHKIIPEWNSERETNIPETQRLKDANQDVGGFTTHADCFMNAQGVMGVEDTSTGSLNTTAPIFEHDDERTQMAPVETFAAGPSSAVSSNAPTRGYLAFLEHAMPAFYLELENKGDEKTVEENHFLNKCKRKSRSGFLFAYRKLAADVQYAPLLDRFSRKFKVNEYMTPEIGEGLAVVNEPYEREAMQERIRNEDATQDDELWNYHFAGVVMKDGDDYVTLENYSVGNDKVDNQNWIFQMYGTGDQSFHAEMKGKQGIGNSALSLGFTQAE